MYGTTGENLGCLWIVVEMGAEGDRHQQAEEKKQRMAERVYRQRLKMSRHTDADQDWQVAGKILGNPLRRALFECNGPLIGIEKTVWEPVNRYLENAAAFNILTLLSTVGILLVVGSSFVANQDKRHEQDVLTA